MLVASQALTRQHRQFFADVLEKWKVLEILYTRVGETPRVLAFIRVLPIRECTSFPGEVLEKRVYLTSQSFVQIARNEPQMAQIFTCVHFFPGGFLARIWERL